MHRVLRVFRPLMCLLSLVLAAGSARPAAAGGSALDSLRRTVVDQAAQAVPYVDVLQRAGDDARAELLRTGALAAHMAQLETGRSAPLRLGEVIDGAAALGAPAPQSPLALRWQAVFNAQVALEWVEPAQGLPPEIAYLQRQLERLAPGMWTVPVGPELRYLAIVRLVNRSPTPLPLGPFTLALGAAGPGLDCAPPAPDPGSAGPVLPDPGELVPPGGARPFVCRTVARADGRADAARAARGEAPVRLLPRHFDSPAALAALVGAIGSGHAVDGAAWARRFDAERPQPAPDARGHQGPPKRSAAPAGREDASRPQRPMDVGSVLQRLGFVNAAMLGALVMFVLGRLLRRVGAGLGGVLATSYATLFGVAVLLIAKSWEAPSGDGWGRAAPFFVALYIAAGVFLSGALLTALHLLHRELDKAQLTWPGTVVRAFRRTADFGGQATRGEFWGYMAAWVAVWLLVRAVARPLEVWIGVLGAVPAISLTVRWLRAMTPAEVVGLGLGLALLVLEFAHR